MNQAKLYILITFVITLWLQSDCSRKSYPQNPPPQIPAEQVAEVKTVTDQLFTQREDTAKLRDAVELLSKVRDPDHRDYETEWKFARLNYFLGLHTTDDNEAESAFNDGKDAAKIASNMEPNKPDGFFWYGANLGELCKRSPLTVGLQSVGDVQNAMNKVIELQPNYQGASAYDGLAQVELATRLKGGSPEKAVEYLEKGIALEGDNTNLHVHLAEAFLALDKQADAKKQLDTAIHMTPNPDYLPEHKDAVAAARKILDTKFQ